MIPQETIQKILDSALVEEVVGDFVSLKKRGAEWWGCCPFHNEKTPSFHVVPAKGIYYCFGCHKGGSAVGFVMEHEHMSYPDALRYLARKYHIEIVEKEESAEDIASRQRNESLMLVSEFAGTFFQEQLKAGEGKTVGLAYFRNRGLEDATIEKYGLGWAPSDRHSFTDAARAKGFKPEYLLETGLCAKHDDSDELFDRFVERVIFPIHSVSGRVIAFGARTLRSKVDGKPYAKYVNSKESDIYAKNRSLYGIWFAKSEMARKDKCYLVEGYLDVLSMHQLGITNVVASSGTALTEGQIRLVKRFTQNVTIMYDGDSAGINAALRGIDMFLREGMNVKVVLLPDGDDPDSFSRKHSMAEVEAFIAGAEQDFVDFKASYLMQDAGKDPLKRAAVINDIADTIADIPDAVKRETYIDFVSEKFSIRRDALDERIGATRSKNLIEQKKAYDRRREREYDDGRPPVADLREDQRPEAAPLQAASGIEALEDFPKMGKAERDLLSFILTYGTTRLEFQSDSEFCPESDEDARTVFDFIDEALGADEPVFSNTVYRTALEAYSKEYYEGYSQEEIVKHLLDGADRKIAEVVSQLSTEDRYDLTIQNLKDSMMTTGSWLTKYVPKAILFFHSSVLEVELDAIRKRIRQAETEGDPDKVTEALSDLMSTRRKLKAVKVRLGREK